MAPYGPQPIGLVSEFQLHGHLGQERDKERNGVERDELLIAPEPIGTLISILLDELTPSPRESEQAQVRVTGKVVVEPLLQEQEEVASCIVLNLFASGHRSRIRPPRDSI